MALSVIEEKRQWFHIISAIVFCFIIANLVYLNLVTLQAKNASETVPIAVTPTIGPSQLLLTPTMIPSPTIAIGQVEEKPTRVPTQKVVPLVKEHYIPFGTGTSSAGEWQDLLGLRAYVDTTNYPGIKSATFEVSLHNLAAGQEVSVRLYNATDGHFVINSEITYTGGNTSDMLVSKPVVLSPGNKLYKVQVKTQLQSPVMIDNSRLHIILE